jgi:lactoylglutathione lyase
VGHSDKGRLRTLWIDLLGLSPGKSHRDERENVEEDILVLGNGPLAVEIDLMQPIDPTLSPRVHEPALNHIGLWVDDLDAAYEWLGARGVRFAGGVREGAAGRRVAFIHPKGSDAAPQSGEGVLIELVQAPDAVRRAFESSETEANSV